MRVGIISDIHSNLEALTAVFERGKDLGIERYVCLGDVVGYGADPNPCCDLLREKTRVCLMGNHDAAVIGAMDDSYYYAEARDALEWTRQKLSDENLLWLYARPYSFVHGDYGFFHAAPIQPSGFYYVIHEQDAFHHVEIFDRLPKYSFIGHSHLTQSFIVTRKGVQNITGGTTTPGRDEKVIITVGSVGQPRDRNPNSCFVLLDTDSGEYAFHRVPYEIPTTAGKIEEAGLSKRFAQRLYEGA